MDVRSPFFQNIAAALAGILFLNPIMVAAADATLAAANASTGVTQAGNGVPVVNIATPNGNGLSHNQFTDYNVGQQGLILNNATAKTQSTQLGGIILGNPNLKGQAANLILNEVTGGSPSQLRGYTEVAGQQAHVVVANPNGITCNGCGFINTPRATLTTGKPIIEGGRLDRLQVDGGAISIEGQGLNATNVDQFDLITRSAKINAELHANQLNIITGANDVAVADLAVSKRVASKADEPLLAIDSSALGGMYAGAIRLVGTEQGVGVKLAGNMAASAGDIQIDASGKLSLAQTAASGSVRIAADSLEASGKVYAGNNISAQVNGELNNQQSLAARDSIALSADRLVNRGVVEAGVNPDGSRNTSGNLSVTARELDNRDSTLAASRQLQVNTRATLNNQGGTLSAGNQTQVTAANLDNSNGRVLSQGALTMAAGALNNSDEGLVYGKQSVAVQAGTLDNRTGQISSKGQAEIEATSLDNRQGSLVSEGSMAVEAQALDNRGGLVSGWQSLGVKGDTLDNSAGGTLSSKNGKLTVELQSELNNSGQGALVSKGDLKVQAASLDNSAAGVVSGQAKVTLDVSDKLDNQGGLVSSQDDLQIDATEVDSRGGEIGSGGNLLLRGTSLDNSAGQLTSTGSFTLELLGLLNNANGQLASAGPLSLSSGSLVNRGGKLVSQGLLELLTGDLDNSTGTLAASAKLQITASGQLNNGQDGLIYSEQGDVELAAAALDNSTGTITSKGQLGLQVDGALNNQQGVLQSKEGDLRVEAASLDNSAEGTLSSLVGWVRLQLDGLFDNRTGITQGKSLEIASGDLRNDGGFISAANGDTTITAAAVENGKGELYAKGLLKLIASSFSNQGSGAADNQLGKVAANRIDFSLSGALNNHYGLIESSTTLAINAASLVNSQGKLRSLGASDESLIDVDLLDNRSGLIEVGNNTLRLQVDDLKNSGGQINHAGSGDLILGSSQAIAAGGTLSTNGELNISAQSWTNSGILQAARLLLNVNQFNQTISGQLLAKESLTATGGSWSNSGLIASDGALSLILSGVYSGGGSLSSQGRLTFKAANLNLGGSGRIGGGDLFTIDINGILSNSGKITSAKDLRVVAGAINNYGAVGSGDSLRLTATNLLNDHGLIFSGKDMALRGSSLINLYGDIYSFGDLSVARNDQRGLMAGVENLSGTLEAAGDISLAAQSLINRKNEFEVKAEEYSSALGVRCFDCTSMSGSDFVYNGLDSYRSHLVWMRKYRSVISKNSPQSNILAGSGIDISAGTVLNSNSVISAGKDILIFAGSVDNTGSDVGSYVLTQYLDFAPGFRDWDDIVRYNVFNDEDYNRDLHFWDSRGNHQVVDSTYKFHGGSKPPDREMHQNFATFSYYLGNILGMPGSSGSVNDLVASGRIGSDSVVKFDASRYGSGVEVSAPSNISGARVFSEVTESIGGMARVQATIQAGGEITVRSSDYINNGIERPGLAQISNGVRVGETSVSTGASSVIIDLNKQLPADLQQRQVNPLTLPGFSIPQNENGLFRLSGLGGPLSQTVEGAALPGDARQPGTHRYLIETNPELTNLKSFMGSDYLLDLLGYDLDRVNKRLGDGLYEQRLMREAMVARTGQRFLAGLTSDEAMFKYLMDNAVASKAALKLSLGVSLTAEQVAALTHDIVWLEEHEVLGEKVLVPVLYLAQAEGRLAANGALIQGKDVNLISGGDLTNRGTLRATDNLVAKGQNIANAGGLVEAGERLDLLAVDSIRNTQGGIITGRDVSLFAERGDISNERTVLRHSFSQAGSTSTNDYVDSAARIEAGNSLSLSAGRDISNVGATIKSQGDIALDAGRDVNLAAATELHQFTKGQRINDEHLRQLGGEMLANKDIHVNAGRDITVSASRMAAGGDVDMAATRDLSIVSAANEDHFYSKGKRVTRSADEVSQVGSSIEAGGKFSSASGRDTTLVASQISSEHEAYLFAGGDLALDSAQDEIHSYYYKKKKSGGMFNKSKKSKMSEASTSQAVSSSIRAGDGLTLVANNDITARGALLSSDEHIAAYAGHDIILDAAESTSSQASAKSKSNLFSSRASSQSSFVSSLTSTTLDGESIELKANNDIVLKASAVHAEKDILLRAGRDVSISTAQQIQESSSASQSDKFNWNPAMLLATNGPFTQTNKAKGAYQTTVQEVGSTLSGDSINISSGRDSTIRGSTLVADRNIRVDAARNLSVISGEASSSSGANSKTKNTGEIGSWYQGATGVASVKETSANSSTTQISSQIASLGGNVSLVAGDRYSQVASSVISPVGDITIQGKQVSIEAGYDRLNATHKQSSSTTAVGGSISVPLVDAVRNIQQMKNAAENTGDSRLQALAAVNTAMNAQRAYEGAQAVGTGNLTGIKISVNLSNNKGNSSSSQSGQNVVSSSVAAGGDVNISALGDGKNSNLNVVGSQIEAGHNVNLKAGGDINLVSAQNTAQQHGNNANNGWSVGVGFGLGSQNGFTLDLAANKGKGYSKGESITHSNTAVRAGDTVNITSGEDTNLKGAVVSGNQVQAQVGGDLNLASQQDIDNYKSKQQDASVGVSVCIPPFCYGVSGSAAFGEQKIDSTYASVTEQTGIKAGDGGFQINVKGNTDLKGAVIASTDKAVIEGKNSLTTGTLTHSDIKNKAEYDATSINVSGGYAGQTKKDDSTGLGTDTEGNISTSGGGKSPASEGGVVVGTPIVLGASGKDSSRTVSGISGGVITITDETKQKELTGESVDEAVAGVNRDVSSEKDGSNSLDKIFDRDEVEAGFVITRQFVQNVGTFLDDRARETAAAKKEIEKEQSKPRDQWDTEKLAGLAQLIQDNETWETGGTGRRLISALSGAASGNVTGGSAQLIQGATINYLQSLATEQVGRIADALDSETARTALQAVVGCAGATAQGKSCSSGALAASSSVVLNNLLEQLRGRDADALTEEEKQARINLVSTLVSGVVAAAGGDAIVAANTANIETSNNYLDQGDSVSFGLDMLTCKGDEACQQKKWKEQAYAEESIYNENFAKDVSGPLLAKDKMLQISAGLREILAMQCDTSTCETYKQQLIESALTSYQSLSGVAGEWAPSMDRLSLILGASTTPSEGLKPRPPGTPSMTGGAQVEKAIEYFTKVKLAQRAMDVRAGLSSDLRRSGNVAVAEIDIPGLPRQMAAHSQVSLAGKGLVGAGSGNFVAQSVPNKAGDLVYRGIDTEYKILDNIADQLGGDASARGAVNIFTEKPACASCLGVVEQFKAKYPNIIVNILDNRGVMLRPPRKTL